MDPASLPVEVTIDAHGFCMLTTDDDIRVLHALTGWSMKYDVPLEGLVSNRPSLEDIYLSLVGHDGTASGGHHEPTDPPTSGATR